MTHNKYSLSLYVKEVNKIPCNNIEETPEALLEWYLANTKSLNANDELDSHFIILLTFVEAWLFDNKYINEINHVLNFHFEQNS